MRCSNPFPLPSSSNTSRRDHGVALSPPQLGSHSPRRAYLVEQRLVVASHGGDRDAHPRPQPHVRPRILPLLLLLLELPLVARSSRIDRRDPCLSVFSHVLLVVVVVVVVATSAAAPAIIFVIFAIAACILLLLSNGQRRHRGFAGSEVRMHCAEDDVTPARTRERALRRCRRCYCPNTMALYFISSSSTSAPPILSLLLILQHGLEHVLSGDPPQPQRLRALQRPASRGVR